jgi:hypothetical protein
MSTAADTGRPAAAEPRPRAAGARARRALLTRWTEHLVNRLELAVTAENRDEVICAALRAHLDFWPEQAPAGAYRVDGQGRARMRRPWRRDARPHRAGGRAHGTRCVSGVMKRPLALASTVVAAAAPAAGAAKKDDHVRGCNTTPATSASASAGRASTASASPRRSPSPPGTAPASTATTSPAAGRCSPGPVGVAHKALPAGRRSGCACAAASPSRSSTAAPTSAAARST